MITFGSGVKDQNKEIEFYTIQRKHTFYSSVGFSNSYLEVFITLDQQVDQYQRTVYSFLDMFGFVGGIYELIKILGYTIATFFTNNLLYFSILSNLRGNPNKDKENSNNKEKEDQISKTQFDDARINVRKVLPIHYKSNEISVQSIDRSSNLEVEEQKSSVHMNSSNNLDINQTNF